MNKIDLKVDFQYISCIANVQNNILMYDDQKIIINLTEFLILSVYFILKFIQR